MNWIAGISRHLGAMVFCWSINASAGNEGNETAAQPLTDVPNLRARIQAYEADNPLDAGLSEEDRALLMRGLDEIEARMPDPGLRPGDIAPDFALRNAGGKRVRLYDLLSQGPVVLTFYRGIWCPYCNLQLRALTETLPLIESYGAQLVAVTPQKPDFSVQQAENDRYPFQILSDLESSVMKSYRLYYELPEELKELYIRRYHFDLAEYNGKGRYVLPVPGTFIIDMDRRISAAFAKADYTQRMEPADILGILHVLQQNRGRG
jgi:peroxiredoxin